MEIDRGFLKEATVAEIGEHLRRKRELGRPLDLFLGHKAGGFFNNEHLYGILKLFSLRPFDTLPNTQKFEECYNVLSSNRFGEMDIQNILLGALNSINYRKSDEILSALIQEGLFKTIITTNIDTLLEDACGRRGMKQPYEYKVIIHGIDDSKTISKDENRYKQIIKIFGDLKMNYSTAGKKFELDRDQTLKEFLCTTLSEEVLVVGYDPAWDQPMEQAFLEAGKMLWYINEELPPEGTHLAHVLNQRKGKYLVGNQGSYGEFLITLYESVRESLTLGGTLIAPAIIPAQTSRRKKAFISYSHENKEQLKKLETHLRGYLHVGMKEEYLNIWVDTKILSGSNWEEEIKEALESTKVAVLLVSSDFLASDFIREHEIPALLKAAEAKEITLLSVLLSPCVFARTPLAKYQVVSSVEKPILSMTNYEQDVEWAKLAERIYDILSSQDK